MSAMPTSSVRRSMASVVGDRRERGVSDQQIGSSGAAVDNGTLLRG
jgi:hypothetical protein